MRKLLILVCLVAGISFQAQDKKPLLEKEGKLIKYTSFHDNGAVDQIGYFKNNKLDGPWKKYDANGNKLAMATYKDGKKVGKWFFWTEKGLKEVNYDNNTIVKVQSWKEENTVAIK